MTVVGTRYDDPLTAGAVSPILFPTNGAISAMNPNPIPPPIEHRFKPGNPGGSAPRGKRISTWMAEFGEMPPSKWPSKDRLKKMPANASIAMARIRKAATKDGLRDTELVLDRTEGAVVPEPSAPMLSQIAAAIMALKSAGVEIRAPRTVVDAEVVPPPALAVEPTKHEGEEDDEDERTKRFRRGRA